jgi:corin
MTLNNSRGDTTTMKAPPLSQIHHSKINQRQDSSISSDSYSMISSPGYNTGKNMDAPLLQNASRINKSKNIHHQDSTDSFIMSTMNKNVQQSKAANVRHDSSISNDSFSQTSNAGFKSKLLDAPLLAHAVKLHACKLSRYLVVCNIIISFCYAILYIR